MATGNLPAASKDELHLGTLTWGWLIRRSMLWVFILAVAIVSACGLYAVASPGSTDPAGEPETQAARAAKLVKT